MKSRLILACAIAVFIISGCGFQEVVKLDPSSYLGYQPVAPPLPVLKVKYYDIEENIEKETNWMALPSSILKPSLLPLQTAEVSLSQTDYSGKVSIIGSTTTGKAGNYEVIMDYMKYRVDDYYKDGVNIGSGQIGIGLRMTARVVTNQANLNLAGLAGLAIEAQRGHLFGSISVDIIGVDSKDVTTLLPLSSQIDQTSIQSALQALASIKSKIWDPSTILTPHLFALKQAIPDVGSEIRIQASEFKESDSGGCLEKFWKPDGVTIDTVFQEQLKEWMASHGLDSRPGTITMFLNGDNFENFRVQAIGDLNLNCK